MLVRDIGAIIKTHVPTLASSFDELEDRHQNILISHLQNMYDINPNDETVLDFINDKASARYHDCKYRCRRHFKKYGVPVPLEVKQRREQWDWLLKNEFLDQAKMAISQRNQRNRTKNPNLMNHHSGSKPLIHRAEEHYETGSLAPRIQAAIDGYIKCPNNTDIMESLQSSLKEIGQSQTAAAAANNTEVEPACLDVELDVLVKCFGERQGTEVRGMGGAVRRPPKKRGGGWSTESSAKRQELEKRAERAEERAERAERAEQRMEMAEERARKTDEKCDQLSAADEDMQKRMEAMEQLMRQFLTPQPSS